MKRAAELAIKNNFKWIRLLDREQHKAKGTDSSPVFFDRKSGTIYPSDSWEVNLHEHILNSQYSKGVNYARVWYFEFARDVDCSLNICGSEEYSLEACLGERTEYTDSPVSIDCDNKKIANSMGGHQKCLDTSLYMQNRFCQSAKRAAYLVHGWIDESLTIDQGHSDWYSTDKIYAKYSKRVSEWHGRKKLTSKDID